MTDFRPCPQCKRRDSLQIEIHPYDNARSRWVALAYCDECVCGPQVSIHVSSLANALTVLAYSWNDLTPKEADR